MDTLSHIMIPLIVAKFWEKKLSLRDLILIALFAALPDFDIFTGVHRSLFHSLIFFLPLVGVLAVSSKKLNFKLSELLILATSLHLVMDFLSGGLPFLYPFVELTIGVEFPLVMKYDAQPRLIEYLPKVVIEKPTPVYGKTFDLISSFGVVCLILFLVLNINQIKIFARRFSTTE